MSNKQPPPPVLLLSLCDPKERKLIMFCTRPLFTGNIMRVSREMMRVKFYPSGQMRYITPDEWRTGHYAENDISARNRHFLMRQEYESLEKEQDLYDPLAEDMARLEALRLEAPSQEQEQHHHHQVEVEQLEVSSTRYQTLSSVREPLPCCWSQSHIVRDKRKKDQLVEGFTNT